MSGRVQNVCRRCPSPTLYWFFGGGNKKLVRPPAVVVSFSSRQMFWARNRAVTARHPIDIYGTLHDAHAAPPPPPLPVTRTAPARPKRLPSNSHPNVINGLASPRRRWLLSRAPRPGGVPDVVNKRARCPVAVLYGRRRARFTAERVTSPPGPVFQRTPPRTRLHGVDTSSAHRDRSPGRSEEREICRGKKKKRNAA